EWIQVLSSDHPTVPNCYETSSSDIVNNFRKLIILKVFRPDLIAKEAPIFISSVFNDEFLRVPELNLLNIVTKELNCYFPLLLVSMPGYDVSYRVDNLARQLQKQCISIAMGTLEAYERADKMLKMSIKDGSWILLKKVHLSPQYLVQLENRLHEWKLERQIHPSFRLFMTSEIHPSLPSNLLRRSY